MGGFVLFFSLYLCFSASPTSYFALYVVVVLGCSFLHDPAVVSYLSCRFDVRFLRHSWFSSRGNFRDLYCFFCFGVEIHHDVFDRKQDDESCVLSSVTSCSRSLVLAFTVLTCFVFSLSFCDGTFEDSLNSHLLVLIILAVVRPFRNKKNCIFTSAYNMSATGLWICYMWFFGGLFLY